MGRVRNRTAGLSELFPIFLSISGDPRCALGDLLLFLVSAVLLVAGLKRAFRDPERYREKISGIVLGVLSVAVFGLFWFSTYYFTRLLPSSADAPRVGQRAPDFALADATGKTVALSEMLKSNRAVLLIFYRGYW